MERLGSGGQESPDEPNMPLQERIDLMFENFDRGHFTWLSFVLEEETGIETED